MSLYEIEIKSLLGAKENADNLREKINKRGASFLTKNNQLNHYFTISDVTKFKNILTGYISADKRESFERILNEGNNFSIRTRDTDGEVKLVVKASIGIDSSSNGVSRMEFEDKMSITLEQLDKLLLNSGLECQAKWSREREEYRLDDINICLDKNAGYGYLVEFEMVVEDKTLADSVKANLLGTMQSLGVEELPQDRLERMFAYYNANWRDYYGTDNVFNIE
ncbi:MAG: CYTH domain-containing protein [Candidatus Zambryskibacteria bacterium]|nr:CYTH domain-containing protein [Candidatus Zambryskibacteria bacterium]